MDRMIVCGWDEAWEPMLRALAEHAQLDAIAVGDTQPAHLVRARMARGLACFQHLRQMVHELEFDAAAVFTADLADDVATIAAARGADLLLLGEEMDSAALEAATTASIRHGARLAVLRPAVRTAGLAFLGDLIDGDPRWTPAILDFELRDHRSATAVFRDAIAAAVRLVDQPPDEVVVSAAGIDPDEPAAIAAQLRYTNGALVTVRARGFLEPALRLWAQTSAGTAEVERRGDESIVVIAPWGALPERTELPEGDALTREAQRVARIRSGEPLDARFALQEAAVLRAAEEALASGAAMRVAHSSMRATLRLLAGGTDKSSPRLGQLHLVSAPAS